jgi:hypothetical protein
MTVCHFCTVSSDLIILNRFDAKISFRIRPYPQIPHNMHENYLLTRSFEKIVGHIIPEAEVPAVNVRYDVRLGLELAAAHTPQVRNQDPLPVTDRTGDVEIKIYFGEISLK